MRNTLFCVLFISLLLCGIGCIPKPENFRSGKIVKIDGTLPGLMTSKGAHFGNESMKIGELTLILHVECPDGLYVFEVTDGPNVPKQNKTNLCSALKLDTQIRFPTSIDNDDGTHTQKFSKSRLGTVYSDYIELLPDVEISRQ